MLSDKYNIIPVMMATALHAAFVTSLLVVFDFGRPVRPPTPLAMTATLVSAAELDTSPPVRRPAPAPEPVIDTSEQDRIAAEEKKRQEDADKEQARISRENEAERKRRADEAAERKRRDEAELERKRVDAEARRQEEIERQRQENERLRAAALAQEAEELRLREIADEDARLAALSSGAMARYSFAIQQKIQRNWVKPASAQAGIECVIDVRVARGGDVLTATVGRCNGDAAVRRSIEAAVFKASPLPEPEDPNLFQRDLRITFKPEE